MSPLRFSTFYFLIPTLFLSCGGSPHPRAISGTTADAPHFIELKSEVRVATLHFPAGLYSLSAVDKIGYYYRAPHMISEHTAARAIPRQGGIFLSKRNRAKLRGYIYLAGAVTHVGNLSHADYQFRD
jgi:hypothetical protein